MNVGDTAHVAYLIPRGGEPEHNDTDKTASDVVIEAVEIASLFSVNGQEGYVAADGKVYVHTDPRPEIEYTYSVHDNRGLAVAAGRDMYQDWAGIALGRPEIDRSR